MLLNHWISEQMPHSIGLSVQTSPATAQTIPSGTDKYVITWDSTSYKGVKFFGNYSISYPYQLKKLLRIEKVDGVIPHLVQFSEIKGVRIFASGYVFGQTPPTIKIFRNGKICGLPVSTGSGATNARVCRP